ncbi:hypothetical protein F4819DRAFT_446236 [Hypoxylon fuscum]|nr:hypothetical protein F4819DRAFT_446236 [Hypoxylon fuscum]
MFAAPCREDGEAQEPREVLEGILMCLMLWLGHFGRDDSWDFWESYSVEELLGMLETRSLSVSLGPVRKYLCIVTDLHRADSEDTRDLIRRMIKVLARIFVDSGKGDVLLFYDSPCDVAGLVEDQGNVADLC